MIKDHLKDEYKQQYDISGGFDRLTFVLRKKLFVFERKILTWLNVKS